MTPWGCPVSSPPGKYLRWCVLSGEALRVLVGRAAAHFVHRKTGRVVAGEVGCRLFGKKLNRLHNQTGRKRKKGRIARKVVLLPRHTIRRFLDRAIFISLLIQSYLFRVSSSDIAGSSSGGHEGAFQVPRDVCRSRYFWGIGCVPTTTPTPYLLEMNSLKV